MELNTVIKTGTWSDAADQINSNFNKTSIEVEKIKLSSTRNKGLYPTIEALKAAIPSPVVGDWAIVGNTIPGYIYQCKTNGLWSNTGQTGGGEVELFNYYTKKEIDPKLAKLDETQSEQNEKFTKEINNININKQDKLNFDIVPTEHSANPITSGGVREALDIQKEEVDSAKDKALEEIGKKEQSAIDNFLSQKIIPEMLSPAVKDMIETAGGGTINNMPDDEDLTKEQLGEGKYVLKFANRRYNTSAYSGRGYKILRKNIMPLSLENNANIITQNMINETNTIYEIRYDFDLNGTEISIPNGCTLKFSGGSIKNGIINGNNTKIISEIETILYDIKIKGTWNINIAYSDWFHTYKDGYKIDSVRIDNSSNIKRYYYTVNGREYESGNIPLDIYHDDTIPIQQLFNLKARHTIISEGIYMIDPTYNPDVANEGSYGGIRCNGIKDAIIEINGVLKAIPKDKDVNRVILKIQESTNIILKGKGELQGDICEKKNILDRTGNFGLWVNSTTDLKVYNLSFNYNSMDGVLVGWRKYYSKYDNNIQNNHFWQGIKCLYNARTGFVYERGDDVIIELSNFSYNGIYRGLSTYSGIDIEPFGDASSPIRYCKNFIFRKNRFYENGGVGLRLERAINFDIYGNDFYKNTQSILVLHSGFSSENITSSDNRRYIAGSIRIYGNYVNQNYGSAFLFSYTTQKNKSRVYVYDNYIIDTKIFLEGAFRESYIYNNIVIGCQVPVYLYATNDTEIYNNKFIGVQTDTSPYALGNNSAVCLIAKEGEANEYYNITFYNNKFYYMGGKTYDGFGKENGKGILPYPEPRKFMVMIKKDFLHAFNIYNNYIDSRFSADPDFNNNNNIYGYIPLNCKRTEEDAVFFKGDVIESKYGQIGFVISHGRIKCDTDITFTPNMRVEQYQKIKNDTNTAMCVCHNSGNLGSTFPIGYEISGDVKVTPIKLKQPKIHWRDVGSCLSTDRPTLFNSKGRKLIESDTGKTIEYNGTSWSEL